MTGTSQGVSRRGGGTLGTRSEFRGELIGQHGIQGTWGQEGVALIGAERDQVPGDTLRSWGCNANSSAAEVGHRLRAGGLQCSLSLLVQSRHTFLLCPPPHPPPPCLGLDQMGTPQGMGQMEPLSSRAPCPLGKTHEQMLQKGEIHEQSQVWGKGRVTGQGREGTAPGWW